MKKLTLAFLIIMTFCLNVPNVIGATTTDNPGNTETKISFPLNPKPSHGDKNRSLIPDIEATYFMEAITFVFNTDLGNCIIDVININTGDTWSASYDGIGSTSLYLSGDSGNYMIYIDTENGAYTGEFVL